MATDTAARPTDRLAVLRGTVQMLAVLSLFGVALYLPTLALWRLLPAGADFTTGASPAPHPSFREWMMRDEAWIALVALWLLWSIPLSWLCASLLSRPVRAAADRAAPRRADAVLNALRRAGVVQPDEPIWLFSPGVASPGRFRDAAVPATVGAAWVLFVGPLHSATVLAMLAGTTAAARLGELPWLAAAAVLLAVASPRAVTWSRITVLVSAMVSAGALLSWDAARRTGAAVPPLPVAGLLAVSALAIAITAVRRRPLRGIACTRSRLVVTHGRQPARGGARCKLGPVHEFAQPSELRVEDEDGAVTVLLGPPGERGEEVWLPSRVAAELVEHLRQHSVAWPIDDRRGRPQRVPPPASLAVWAATLLLVTRAAWITGPRIASTITCWQVGLPASRGTGDASLYDTWAMRAEWTRSDDPIVLSCVAQAALELGRRDDAVRLYARCYELGAGGKIGSAVASHLDAITALRRAASSSSGAESRRP